MLLLALALLQDPIDALLTDLGSGDETIRQKAIDKYGALEERQQKKAAAEAARGFEKAQTTAIQELLAKRPDGAALKKRVKEIKDLIQQIPYPTYAAHMKIQGELRGKLEALWKEQYPDLTAVGQTEARLKEAAKLGLKLAIIAGQAERTAVKGIAVKPIETITDLVAWVAAQSKGKVRIA